MQIIKIENKEYPENLRKIKNPPNQLYTEGNIELLKENGIAIVGSRRCSDYGEKMTKKFARELTTIGINVISGMALGVDGLAHSETIKNSGKTIAVLPTGFHKIYPPQHIELYNKILKSGGLVVSEYPPSEEQSIKKFRERNRIVSGLSLCVIITEAGYRSGTSITARYARQEDKKVFCVPSSLDNKCGIGANRLIKEGANLLSGIGDIIAEYPNINFRKIEETKQIQGKIPKEYIKVYNAISNKTTDIDFIYDKVNETIGEISFKLTMLEIGGFIKQSPGGFYKKN